MIPAKHSRPKRIQIHSIRDKSQRDTQKISTNNLSSISTSTSSLSHPQNHTNQQSDLRTSTIDLYNSDNINLSKNSPLLEQFSNKNKIGSMIGTNKSALQKRQRVMSGATPRQQRGARTLNIRIGKPAPTLSKTFEEDSWKQFRETIDAVHNTKPVSYSRQELSQTVESICTHKLGERLYSRVRELCDQYIANTFQTLSSIVEKDPFSLLGKLREDWDSHQQQMIAIRAIFIYLDRNFVAQCSTVEVKSLQEMGLVLFRRHLLANDTVKRAALNGLLDAITRERNGEAIDVAQEKSLIRMFSSLHIYASEFEPQYLQQTTAYFKREGETNVHTLEPSQYLLRVEQRLSEEINRVHHYLELSTQRSIVEIVEDTLLRSHLFTIVSRGFKGMMDDEDTQSLTRMYGLFKRVGDTAVEEIKGAWSNYIADYASHIVSDTDKEKEKLMIPALLTLKDKTDRVWENCFDKSDSFAYAMKSAFESSINRNAQRVAELLAKFADVKLKAGNKQETEDQIEPILDRVIVLFRYIHGKDIFEAFYKKDLAKRLLLNRSASVDLEKSMLQKLKTECGAAFTSKLEGMFKDMDLSSKVMQEYANKYSISERGGTDTSVHVLTSSYWPPYPLMDTIILPPVFKRCTDAFETFYHAKFGGGRRLHWQHSLAHVHLKARFNQGRKELQVSLFQSLVLLLWNDPHVIDDGDKINFGTIKEKTGIEDAELRRTLQSLSLGKVRVLIKGVKSKEVKDDEIFTFNKKFTSKLLRLRINTVQVKETKQEQKETNERVFREREHQIDAAVVRIMKTRQTLSHQLLMAETMGSLKFTADPSDIKKRIESLIERDYMERDDDDPQTYLYVA